MKIRDADERRTTPLRSRAIMLTILTGRGRAAPASCIVHFRPCFLRGHHWRDRECVL